MAGPETVLALVRSATERLVTTCRGLSDAGVRAPSLLPGWSRGHVLTHLARNADSLVNLLTWAGTGVQTPQYASQQARDADIEAGAPRPLERQIADIEAATDRFLTTARSLPDAAWDVVVRGRGGQIAARDLPWLRLRELEVHHVDLDAGYTARQWPREFVSRLLSEAINDFAGRHGVPALRLRCDDLDATIGVGMPTTTVSGEDHAVLAWLIGRSDGTGLDVAPPGPLPDLPAWR